MDKAALRSELEALCQEVGEFILGERRQVRAGQIETKSLNSLVSYVDQEAEKKLVKRLKQLLTSLLMQKTVFTTIQFSTA